MFRTQIYLTHEAKASLEAITLDTNKSQSELIREAVDNLIAKYKEETKGKKLLSACGIWQDNNDAEFKKIRSEFDRDFT